MTSQKQQWVRFLFFFCVGDSYETMRPQYIVFRGKKSQVTERKTDRHTWSLKISYYDVFTYI